MFAAGAVCNIAAGERRKALENQCEQPREVALETSAKFEVAPDSVSSQSKTTEQHSGIVASGSEPAFRAQEGWQEGIRQHGIDDGKSGKLFGWLSFWSVAGRSS